MGFRKIDAQRGSWIARARAEDGRQQYQALGALTETFDYDAACAAAREWFASLDAGVVARGLYTAEGACKAYVADRRREKGEKTAADAEWRFKHTVYGTALGKTEMSRLRTPAKFLARVSSQQEVAFIRPTVRRFTFPTPSNRFFLNRLRRKRQFGSFNRKLLAEQTSLNSSPVPW